MLEHLKRRWLTVKGSHNISLSDTQFQIVCEKYSEKHRYYHTLEHIGSCLSFFDEISSQLNDPSVVEIALWFHDVIYNPKENNNEEKSALFAHELLKNAGCKSTYIEGVSKLIMATKHPAFPATLEEKYIIDIDLAILGASKETYEHYANQIKKEYSHISNASYQQGRRKVLSDRPLGFPVIR